jgi:hypothetical protein
MDFENSFNYEGANHISRLQRYEDFQLVPPGPMAQAFTFRAFGAETQSFHTASTALGSVKQRPTPN